MTRNVAWGVATAVVLAGQSALAVWGTLPSNAPEADRIYHDAANWEDGVIDDSFWGVPLSGNPFEILFEVDYVATNGIMFSANSGSGIQLRGRSMGYNTNRVLTLWGDVYNYPYTNTANGAVHTTGSTIGANGDANRLLLDLGGQTRTFHAGTDAVGRDISVQDGIYGPGGIIKTGKGTLSLGTQRRSTFDGDVVIEDGTLTLGGDNALGDNAGSLFMWDGTTLNLGGSYDQTASYARRWFFTNGTISVGAGDSRVHSILVADTPLTKRGLGGRLSLNALTNEFSGGFIVLEGTLGLNGVASAGANVPGNDFLIKGGFLTVRDPAIVGDQQVITVDTTDPTLFSGIGVNTSDVDMPPFVRVGDNPGVVIFEVTSSKFLTNETVTALVDAGWHIGATSEGTWNGTTMPVTGEWYRFGGGSGSVHLNTSVLTGDNSLVIGAPVRMGHGNLNLRVPQDYTGETVVQGASQSATTYLTLSRTDGAVTATPKISLLATPLGGHAELRMNDMGNVNGRFERMDSGADIIMASAGSGSAYLRATHNVAACDITNAVGNVILASGRSHIVQGMDSGSTLANLFLTLEASSLQRRNNSLAVLYTPRQNEKTTFVCPSIGVRRDTGAYANGTQIFLGEPLVGIGGTGANGTDWPIIPYLMGCDNTDGAGQAVSSPSSAVTYHPSTGLRALRTRNDIEGLPSEFTATIASAGALDNVRTEAAETVSASKTINALIMRSGDITIDADTRLAITSGLLWAAGGGIKSGGDIAACVIDFGENEGMLFHTAGSVTTFGVSLDGSGGVTIYGTPSFTGKNTYTGQTTIVGGKSTFYRSTQQFANVNESLPDDGHVLLHPGATLQIGSDNAAYATREIIGSVAGIGTIQLGNITIGGANAWKNSTLFIGSFADTNDVSACVMLDGGSISPGMPDEIGTLSITTAAANPYPPIPVNLINGDLAIRIGETASSALAITGDLSIGFGTDLTLAVTIDPAAKLANGQSWTIVTAGSIDMAGDAPFTKVTSNDRRWKFTAEIVDNTVVMTSRYNPLGTTILVR